MYKQLCEETKVYYNEPMKKHTTFKIGGPAETFIIPGNIEEIKNILKTNEKVTIIGNGSNLLVNDDGIKGIVLSMANCFKEIKVEENYIEVGAGVSLNQLAKVAQENGLTGLEWSYGIPGTVGGAVTMNAGAYGGQISDVLVETEYINNKGEIITVSKDEHNFGYRKSIFNKNDLTAVITKCKIELQKGDKDKILEIMNENMTKRKTKQPLEYPSAGSVFKRPEGFFAGKLIEDAGLKGYRVGDAAVSEKHSGFIINLGNATAKDVKELIKIIQQKIFEKNNIHLETEIKML